MSDSMVRRWMRFFNEGCENVHDTEWSERLSLGNDNLMRAVKKKINFPLLADFIDDNDVKETITM